MPPMINPGQTSVLVGHAIMLRKLPRASLLQQQLPLPTNHKRGHSNTPVAFTPAVMMPGARAGTAGRTETAGGRWLSCSSGQWATHRHPVLAAAAATAAGTAIPAGTNAWGCATTAAATDCSLCGAGAVAWSLLRHGTSRQLVMMHKEQQAAAASLSCRGHGVQAALATVVRTAKTHSSTTTARV